MNDAFGRPIEIGSFVIIGTNYNTLLGKVVARSMNENYAKVITRSGNVREYLYGQLVLLNSDPNTDELERIRDQIEANYALKSSPPIPMKSLVEGNVYEDYQDNFFLYIGKGKLTTTRNGGTSNERVTVKKGHIFSSMSRNWNHQINGWDPNPSDDFYGIMACKTKKLSRSVGEKTQVREKVINQYAVIPTTRAIGFSAISQLRNLHYYTVLELDRPK